MLRDDPLFLLAAGASLVVLVILMIGIGGFARGGEFNRKHANRLMRYRIYAQFVAVALIVGFVYIRHTWGN
ncbi:MAG: twin transmembrane helix small protein [Gemmobacter sp.]|uniref:twin transmembrane helix small protein n=1 Tax=Gemmobacter sp. TaxID=1898957 RepID=UPI00391DB505